MKKIFFLFLFLSLCSYSVSALTINEDYNCSTVLVNETFNFPDAYVVRYENESHITSIESCLGSSAPLNNSYFDDDGYMGINLSNIPVACTTQHMRAVWYFDPQNSTISDLLIVEYEFWGLTNTDHSLQNQRTKFLDSGDSYINSAHGISFYPYQEFQPEESYINGLDWGVGNVYWDAAYPFAANYTWIIDLNTGYYDLYVDDVLTLDNYDLGAADRDINAFELWLSYFEGEDFQGGIDNILVCGGESANPVYNNTGCDFPIVFCDDFNYEYNIEREGWLPYTEDFALRYKEPDNFNLKWYSKDLYELSHTYDPFPTSFEQSDGYTSELGVYTPKFTVEFELSITDNTSANFSFAPIDDTTTFCYDMEFTTNANNGINISVSDISTRAQSVIGSISENTTHTIKLVHRFTHLNKSYEFNTSTGQNLLDVYSDGVPIKQNIPFNVFCWNIYRPTFTMNSPSTVIMDDYYAYVGTDKQTSTIPVDYIPVTDTPFNESVITSGQYDTADFKQTLDSFWDDFGMSTLASKALFGIIMLIIIVVFTLGFMLKMGIVSFPALLVVGGLVVILEVFIGLLPLWLFGIFAVVGGGIAILSIRMLVAS